MALPWFEIFVAPSLLWVLVACTTLLLERRSPTATLAWIFAFIAIPVLPGLYSLVFGPRRVHRRRRRYGLSRAALAHRHAHEQEGPAGTRLTPDAGGCGGVGLRRGEGEPRLASAVQLLDDGEQCMQALEERIVAAKHHVHMEYYIWEPDDVGTHFRDLLVAAAGRGVEVRVLYDAVGSPRANGKFWEPLRAAGGQVLPFNPVKISIAGLNFANFRTHRKIAIVDGLAGFLGGINLHNPATATRSGKDAWRDQRARLDGEPTHRIQRLFLENSLYSRGAIKLGAHNLRKYFPPARIGEGVPVQILASGPDDPNAPMHAFFLAAFSTARERILIETPYLIPDEPMETALRIAELRGVNVQVIVPKRGDSRIVTAASHTYCASRVHARMQGCGYR